MLTDVHLFCSMIPTFDPQPRYTLQGSQISINTLL